jgi:hypothetical protein
MIIPQKYLAVNWADGMKVNKEHFIDTENFLTDQLRDTASLNINRINFGMLPPLPGSTAGLSDYLVSKTTTNQLQISINYCQAVTPGGVRIQITNEGLKEYIRLSDIIEEEVGREIKSNTTEYFYVLMVVSPFEKVMFGNPDPEEIPIRQPYTQPRYTLQVVHSSNINTHELGAYHLVIGRIKKQGNEFYKDENFIPPCTAIVSNEKLMHYYKGITQYLSEIQGISMQIIQKINYKNQKSPVAQNIKQACVTILNYCASCYYNLRNILHQQPPSFLIDAMSQMANHLFTYIQTLPESEKEEMLNYFFEWSDITPVTFSNKLSDVIEINYDHYQTGIYFAQIEDMLANVLTVWKKLNTLEYIGLRKENIVVKEEVLSKVTKDRKGWNILD